MAINKFDPNVFGANFNVPTIHGGQYELANKAGYQIKIEHLASGMKTSFQAFLSSYSDGFQSNWQSSTVYGRMDPIQTFQGTQRRINLGWDIPSNDASEAEENLLRCQNLAQMMYPVYEEFQAGATSIKAPPLLRLSFVNLIKNVDTGLANKGGGSPTATGLVGTCDGFQFAPEVDTGFHDPDTGVLFPKVIRVYFNFTVLHTHALGFVSVGRKVGTANSRFPWGAEAFVDSSGVSKIAPKMSNLDAGVKNIEPKKTKEKPNASRSAKKGINAKIKKQSASKLVTPADQFERDKLSRGQGYDPGYFGGKEGRRLFNLGLKPDQWLEYPTKESRNSFLARKGYDVKKVNRYLNGNEPWKGRAFYKASD